MCMCKKGKIDKLYKQEFVFVINKFQQTIYQLRYDDQLKLLVNITQF